MIHSAPTLRDVAHAEMYAAAGMYYASRTVAIYAKEMMMVGHTQPAPIKRVHPYIFNFDCPSGHPPSS